MVLWAGRCDAETIAQEGKLKTRPVHETEKKGENVGSMSLRINPLWVTHLRAFLRVRYCTFPYHLAKVSTLTFGGIHLWGWIIGHAGVFCILQYI